MNGNTYLLIRGLARSVTMTVIVALPISIIFLVEGWAQTW